jgi:hypothetical protein
VHPLLRHTFTPRGLPNGSAIAVEHVLPGVDQPASVQRVGSHGRNVPLARRS